jgi:hypothetical protein
MRYLQLNVSFHSAIRESREATMRSVLVGTYIFLGLCLASTSCAAPQAPLGTTRPFPEGKNFLDEYIAIKAQGPIVIDPEKPVLSPKVQALDRLLQFYYRQVYEETNRKQRVAGIITDEQGNLLDGVEMHAAWKQPGAFFEDAVTAKRRTMTVDKSFDLDFRGYLFIALSFSKPGFVTESWDSLPEGYAMEHTELTLWDSPARPRSDGKEGVQIVLRREYRFEPPKDPRSIRPKDDKADWPKSVPATSPVIIDSQRVMAVKLLPSQQFAKVEDIVAAPETGTYALVGPSGNVLEMYCIYRGDGIGFVRGEGQRLQYRVMGNGNLLPIEAGPYQWRLYSRGTPATRGS